MALDYYDGGSDDKMTLARNVDAFRSLLIRPRCLQDVSEVNTSVEWYDDMNRPKAKSRDRVRSLQSSSGSHGDRLYVYKDKSITASLLSRALASGCKAVVLTVDTPVFGRRLADARNGFTLPKGLTFANFATIQSSQMPSPSEGQSGFMQYVASQIDPSLNWEVLDWVISNSKVPVLVKGVMRGDDAEEAIRRGVRGIIVSNHGGRQLDSAPATIEALPEVVQSVNGRVPVFLDGGIRNGRDVFKAVALGASGVFIGRPVLWGLSVAGAEGVGNVIKLLQTEFMHTMQLAGCRSIREIHESRDIVVKESYYAKL
ncbi:dehydrogenase, FMN-dependent [Necator americanus]|uniref:Dehydrogenase, FMN-dependent n=1 Tax=Necator americanus TaxID=51031 RepID=W2TVK1_NECAM|nr:dehydrogenase, FMN-dependent [Necator americanus]ETN85818.1 dehydrogenase, FMN-dependent [Necator americanus]